MIRRCTFQTEETFLEKHKLCKVFREMRLEMQRVAKFGVPIFHFCGFQFDSRDLTGVPVGHCCLNKLLKV